MLADSHLRANNQYHVRFNDFLHEQSSPKALKYDLFIF
jgi:hypothetical protein